ncbi:MAG TPA: deoxynucleoside kinase, partial [Phycisphaerae bacterium]|nr:deoxynucleoside kinase [Phycisphaerae bacterium]
AGEPAVSAAMVSIVGAPASGKTTLAEHLAAEMPATLLREDYAGNPFLADSCAGRAEARLPGQLYFLMSRVAQLNESHWPGNGVVVTDYGFCQDAIFAQLRLGADDLRLYERIARRVNGLVHPPEVLVLLEAPPEVLLERIARRGRDFEKTLTAAFLSEITEAYNSVVAEARCPVLRVDCHAQDLRRQDCRAELVRRIRESL